MLQALLVIVLVHRGAFTALLLLWLPDNLALFGAALVTGELGVFLLLELIT